MDNSTYVDLYTVYIDLYRACYTGDVHTVKMLIDNKHKISKAHLREAAEHACQCGHINIMRILIDYGADNYDELMKIASDCGYLPIITWMHDIGGDSTSYTNEDTMYYCAINACQSGYLDIVKFFIDKGAAINYDVCLMVATRECYISIMQLMLKHGATQHDCIDERLTELLLTQGYDINNQHSDECKQRLTSLKQTLVRGYINDLYLSLYDVNITEIICDYVNHY